MDSKGHLLGTKKFLNKFFPVFETSETGDGLEDVRINGIGCGYHVCLNDVHHGQLQLQLPLPTWSHPTVAIYLCELQLYKNT